MSSTERPRLRPSRTLDVALTVALGAFALVPLLLFGLRTGTAGTTTALWTSALMVAPVLIRRRQPMLTMVWVALCCLLQLALVSWPTPALVVVPLTCYSVARWVAGRTSRIVLIPALLGSLIGPLRWLPLVTVYYGIGYASQQGPGGEVSIYLLMVGLCAGQVIAAYAIGRRIRESAMAGVERQSAALERAQLELAEREQSARTAEANVRAQIARELHDVVAHSLSVMIVQAQGGKAVAAKHPDQAVQALDTIAETGREALSQMRRIVGVLRGDEGEQAEFAPSPGLAEIPELVERAGDHRVQLLVTGTRPEVPRTLGLVVYRVVQEAVTNFLKHAGPEARAQINLSYSPTLIVVEVLDDGIGNQASGDGRGHGLQGMQERVASMGGQLVARPRSSGGFLVRAILPVAQRR